MSIESHMKYIYESLIKELKRQQSLIRKEILAGEENIKLLDKEINRLSHTLCFGPEKEE
jgi:hypothetical protein